MTSKEIAADLVEIENNPGIVHDRPMYLSDDIFVELSDEHELLYVCKEHCSTKVVPMVGFSAETIERILDAQPWME